MSGVAGQCDIKAEVCDRVRDIRYICEAHGWTDLVYLLDMVAHEMQSRMETPTEVSVESGDVAVQRRH
ncbi:hypothetical protein AncyloWKF20_19165 [Ancylobacter sp. WKF20]|uniref:hypothetical protein n=1 Tax=Ancylobacter sp. WKF20 TaxID=3039801 RepID=UPI00243454E3|nr:hypothetical protein [Ancylobacter sp. WKF20]WGD29847.1 hypothetical protein AncyloWKF20_19165 [Ancylobacter sp. WKF20]